MFDPSLSVPKFMFFFVFLFFFISQAAAFNSCKHLEQYLGFSKYLIYMKKLTIIL